MTKNWGLGDVWSLFWGETWFIEGQFIGHFYEAIFVVSVDFLNKNEDNAVLFGGNLVFFWGKVCIIEEHALLIISKTCF